MKPDLHQIFKEISTPEPSPELAGLILARIAKLQAREIRRKIAWLHLSLATSSAAFIWATIELGQSFLQSDFWLLLQLLMTDASAVLRNWNDFLFSLLETFPAMSATLILIPVLAILFSLSTYFKLSNRNHYNYI